MAGARFPATRWSIVLAAAQEGAPAGASALSELCRLYWYPVFAYLRRSGHPIHTAQDLTQAFFLHLLERRAFGRADQLKGSFRGFLIGCLKFYESNERERQQALKRGGGVRLVSFDLEEAEGRYLVDNRRSSVDSAEFAFDRHWAHVVTHRALDTIKADFADDLTTYERLKGFLVAGSDAGSYESAAQDLGVSLALLKSAIHRLRRAYRDAVRREIAVTVSAPHEVDEEVRHLINVLAAD
jgi:DNA-directed RNA polymerase specialized sigma24 family protein